MTATIKATPTRPPTMPAAIRPAFELLCEVEVGVDDEPLLCEVEAGVDDEPLLSEVEVGVDDELAEVALGGPLNCAMVDCTRPPPGPRNWAVSLADVNSGESPRASASVTFQLSATDESKYAHLGIAVPAGIAMGKTPGLALASEVQLNVQLE